MKDVFLSCDWGTSSFRLRLVNAVSMHVLAQSQSDEGVSSVYEQWQKASQSSDRISFYQAVLQRHIQSIEADVGYSLAGVAIVASGMTSSSIGMMELPYKRIPFHASGNDLYHKLIRDTTAFPYNILLISGVRTEGDVMRGEETQLAGCTVAAKGKEVFIFPGTHSKHVWVEDGLAVDFQTYMTGELFQLLATKSILSKSVSAGTQLLDNDNKEAFVQGILESSQHNLLHIVFTVRTNSLFGRLSPEQNYWYLSGLMIGAELNVLQQQLHPITIVGEAHLRASYHLALTTLGFHYTTATDAWEATIKAHCAISKAILV